MSDSFTDTFGTPRIKESQTEYQYEPGGLNMLDTELSGICVVHASYEGVRRSVSKPSIRIISNPIIKTALGDTVKFERDVESIVDSMNSMKIFNAVNNNPNGSDVNISDSSSDELVSDDDSADSSGNEGIVKNDKNNRNSETVVSSNIKSRELLLDFANTEPDKYRINVGSGFLTTFMGERFVITCSHIVINSAIKYRTYFKIGNNVKMFDMEVYARMPEIDIAIMRFTDTNTRYSMYSNTNNVAANQSLWNCPNLIDVDGIQEIRDHRRASDALADHDSECIDTDSADNSSRDKTTELVSKIQYHIITANCNSDYIKYDYSTHRIKNLETIYSSLVSSLIDSVPNISIPISDLEIFDDIEVKYGKKIHEIVNYANKRSNDYLMMNEIIRKLRGLSGSIITSKMKNCDGVTIIPIGMIVTFNISINYEQNVVIGTIRAIPMDIIMTIVDNCVRKRIDKLMGIQISYTGCIAEENGDEFYAAIVSKNSSRYVNGRKDFWFNPSDMIIKINQHDLNRNAGDLVIDSKKFGRNVPINSYFLYKANTSPGTEISITIPKVYDKTQKKINYNITPIPYNDMFITRLFHQNEVFWRGYLFLELSEEMIRFYDEIGINLKLFLDGDEVRSESLNGERIVVLFNYDRNFNRSESDILRRRNLTLSEYSDMPCTYNGKRGGMKGFKYFYQLERISNRTINHLEELNKAIDQIEKSGQKKITLLLRNRVTHDSVKMKI
jgi:hypothetical protein